jgi:uncharacterized protein (TIGR03000 family)
MYSIVLMVAMTHGAATPMTGFENGADFNQARYGNHLRSEDNRFGRRGRRRGGCCGGYGGGWSSCGCCGGGYGGGYGGCCGGGWGYGGCGGGGGGWSCCGGYASPVSYGGCTGGFGYGGCTGGVVYGEGMGGWGGSMGAPAGPGRAPMPPPPGAGNPYRYNYGSGYEEPGMGAPPAGGFGPPPAGGFGPPPANGNRTPEPLNPPAGPQTRGEAPATFTVHLPANARLLVDNQPTQSASTTRTFITPPLPENRSFTYTLKAQLDEAGKPLTQTKQITVRGGQNTDVTLQFPAQRLTRK